MGKMLLPFLAGAMVAVGGGMAAWDFVLLVVFLLSDGITAWGENLRSDPEFFAYWTRKLPLMALGLVVCWAGFRMLRWRTEVRGPDAG